MKIQQYQNIKQYPMINNNQAVIYSHVDYYIVLDCKIDGDDLILYKGRYQKINNEGVHVILKKFKKVYIE